MARARDHTIAIPDRVVIDRSRWVHPDDVVSDFNYSGADHTSFTESEELEFVLACKQNQKDFGKIAEVLSGRTYQDCLQHYYAHKHESRFEAESMTQKAQRTENYWYLDIDSLSQDDVRRQALRLREESMSHETFDAHLVGKKKRKLATAVVKQSVNQIKDLVPLNMEIQRLRKLASNKARKPILQIHPLATQT